MHPWVWTMPDDTRWGLGNDDQIQAHGRTIQASLALTYADTMFNIRFASECSIVDDQIETLCEVKVTKDEHYTPRWFCGHPRCVLLHQGPLHFSSKHIKRRHDHEFHVEPSLAIDLGLRLPCPDTTCSYSVAREKRRTLLEHVRRQHPVSRTCKRRVPEYHEPSGKLKHTLAQAEAAGGSFNRL